MQAGFELVFIKVGVENCQLTVLVAGRMNVWMGVRTCFKIKKLSIILEQLLTCPLKSKSKKLQNILSPTVSTQKNLNFV